ncbi:hypothetical protein Y1Q_0023608 [Alligator mississippiensis]|uniref:Uncharacterized protein n=1 Tax=Alligator mississippiensis TaxID=8496 RepID=A0A151MMY9_ALLMI|nr:hypothetical protein Y1Q_0023608 [Alligator mississippiensis]
MVHGWRCTKPQSLQVLAQHVGLAGSDSATDISSLPKPTRPVGLPVMSYLSHIQIGEALASVPAPAPGSTG